LRLSSTGNDWLQNGLSNYDKQHKNALDSWGILGAGMLRPVIVDSPLLSSSASMYFQLLEIGVLQGPPKLPNVAGFLEDSTGRVVAIRRIFSWSSAIHI